MFTKNARIANLLPVDMLMTPKTLAFVYTKVPILVFIDFFSVNTSSIYDGLSFYRLYYKLYLKEFKRDSQAKQTMRKV